jgi:Mg-chelatase subunit ChlD
MAGLSTSALRDELDRLRANEPAAPGVWERLAHRGDASLPGTPELLALDAELGHAGVHTLADARLLGRLARADKRAAALAGGLHRRTRKALAELQQHISALGRAQRLNGKPSATALDRAEALAIRLDRALAVEKALTAPAAAPAEEFRPFPRPVDLRTPPERAEVAAVERYLERARAQGADLRKKRRDLDRAHGLLLSLSAEMKQSDRQRAQGLRAELADERHRLGTLEAMTAPGETLPRAVARALGDGRADQAYRGLLAMHRSALSGSHDGMASASRAALEHLSGGMAESLEQARTRDASRTLADRAGPGALRRLLSPEGAQPDALLETALGLSNAQRTLFDLALTAGELFDASAEDEIIDDAPTLAASNGRRTRVPFPTATMDFATARSIEELRDFVIRDPRLVLYDLASGTQLVRAHYEDQGPAPRRTRKSAVRVYVCDASGSMRGPRARFRDAVLIAELNNLSLRAQAKREVWPIYYAFFTDGTPQLTRVDTAHRAQQLIVELFDQSPARGRTDITWALVSAFEAIHEARGRDPDLARATVVLVTDGEDQVDRSRIDAARAPVGDLEVTLNFISLGQENPDLRSLVMSQKDRGRRAFYTHLTDEDLAASAVPPDASVRTLLPEHPELALTADSPAVKAALDALSALALGTAPTSGPPASTRFAAYFPTRLDPRSVQPAASADLLRVRDLLGAVGDALALAPAEERLSESVELLEHLLTLYGLQLARYRAVLALHDPEVIKVLGRLRLLCGQVVDDAAVEERHGL